MKLIAEARQVLTLLTKRKIREKEGLFVIEGEKLVKEGQDLLSYLLYSTNLPVVAEAQARGIRVLKVSRSVMERITSVETPPGVLGVAKITPWSMADILKGENPLIFIGAEIQDPGNLGTIMRTMDAVKGAGVIATSGTVDPYNPKVVRATMGAIFRVPVVTVRDLSETAGILKKKNVKIVGTDADAKKTYWDAEMKGPAAILVGNEAAGLSPEALGMCDEVVNIPMPGKAESLNAAMAATLILYEALRQRSCNG